MRLRTTCVVLVALVALAVSAFAGPIVVTGEGGYGFAVDPSGEVSEGYYAELYFSASPDDTTTAYLEVASTSEVIELSYFYITSDLGTYLKLGDISLELTGGYYWSGDNSYCSLTSWGAEDVGTAGIGTAWDAEIALSYKDFFTIEFGFDPATPNLWVTGVSSSRDWGFGTVSLEAYYDANEVAIGSGVLVVDGSYARTFGDIGMTVGAGMNTDLAASSVNWSAAVDGEYKSLGGVRASVYGNDTDAVSGIAFDANVTPFEKITLKSGVKLDLTASDILAGWDTCAQFAIGAVTARIGYVLTSTGTGLWAPTTPTDGGFYVRMYASF